MSVSYQKATFLLSVADVKQLPEDEGIEVAIVGRSNAGKSSVLNALTRKGLARVSKTPGRTQLINLFALDEERRLADLPGYGFAKVPIAHKRKWENLINAYLAERQSLKGMVVVMDIRHPFRDLDLILLEYCEKRDLAVHILLNKADKLSKGAAANTLQAGKGLVAPYQNEVSLQLFSAMKKTGLKTFIEQLNEWYG